MMTVGSVMMLRGMSGDHGDDGDDDDDDNVFSDDIEVDDRPGDSLSLPGTKDKTSNSQSVKDNQHEEVRKLPRWIYLSIMFGMVVISLIVISANGNELIFYTAYKTIFFQLTEPMSSLWLKCLTDVYFLSSRPVFFSVSMTNSS